MSIVILSRSQLGIVWSKVKGLAHGLQANSIQTSCAQDSVSTDIYRLEFLLSRVTQGLYLCNVRNITDMIDDMFLPIA